MASSKKKKVFCVVNCSVHGKPTQDANIKPHVKITTKGTRAERQGLIGCPMCRAERIAAERKKS